MAQQGAAGLLAPHAHRRCADRRRHLAGTNTRRVRRALAALFRGAVSKDIVSRVWGASGRFVRAGADARFGRKARRASWLQRSGC